MIFTARKNGRVAIVRTEFAGGNQIRLCKWNIKKTPSRQPDYTVDGVEVWEDEPNKAPDRPHDYVRKYSGVNHGFTDFI